MSGTSSGEVPSDLEEDVASGGGGAGTRGPTITPPSPAMTSVPVEAAASPSPVAELEALAKKQRLVLDKAYRYLLDQEFGIPELASLDLDEMRYPPWLGSWQKSLLSLWGTG